MIKQREKRVDDIDWQRWQPQDRAILLFIIQQQRILLIRKKRGLGAGKISGPGGRVESGESAYDCAIRELQEELHITPFGIREVGELRFQFRDGYSLHCIVFTASHFEGTPNETVEAKPLWFSLCNIPYDEMWADDRLWMPIMLKGHKFKGRFIFDDEIMLDSDIVVVKNSITAE